MSKTTLQEAFEIPSTFEHNGITYKSDPYVDIRGKPVGSKVIVKDHNQYFVAEYSDKDPTGGSVLIVFTKNPDGEHDPGDLTFIQKLG